MSPPLSIVIFLLSAYHTGSIALAASVNNTSESFFKLCPPTRCSNSGPIIRYPFRLNTQPTFCGREGYQLSCSANNTVFPLGFSRDYYVREIYYPNNWISLTEIPKNSPNCPIQSLLSFNRSGSILEEPDWNLVIANCSQGVVETEGLFGPIDCLSDGGDGNGSLFYVMDGSYRMDKLPLQCIVFKNVRIAHVLDVKVPLERLLREGEIVENYRIDYECLVCERDGNYCGFNSTSNETMCSSPKARKSSNVALIVGTSVGGGTTLLALSMFIIYRFRKSDNEKETKLKIEKFLQSYKTLIPTRYTFSEIKGITSRFKKRLGQGGFGSVYQGKLANGIPVAVKVLENSKGNEEEFINEVSTIRRIHHFNVVHLVGFCYEGTWRALVYEFMPNGSLDKFLFSKEGNRSQSRPILNWETLQQIAKGVAHGIEYLHQGCNQRILHFDIKPHNILLDQNFQPKISDFGLAKVCAKNQSVVSMTGARGTEGYIAPELFSKNFGEVSYKSDVYSFGMLLLEMVGYRKNDDHVSDESEEGQIYFPEQIYDRMSKGMELGLQMEMDGDEEIGKKLALVGLWCIQWSPTSRPSMTRVVQMLEGDLGNLEMPPRPFLSSRIDHS
ncbi:rust resistance kinase Lr10-like isoform X1 [Rhododendron vialii]|uniref:rust resistance kinase Lr10-like isoform X1 n=1 Tax=Rhododendron vialii TaxID=182163 RepID=UPI00265F0C36|nr:rust resistance kinase Lr10-like isoform X1 [Rhododendron vialii]